MFYFRILEEEEILVEEEGGENALFFLFFLKDTERKMKSTEHFKTALSPVGDRSEVTPYCWRDVKIQELINYHVAENPAFLLEKVSPFKSGTTGSR